MNATTYGVDIAKHVFQVHWVDPESGEISSKKLSRAKFSEFFARRAAGTIAMEACGGAHHWARTLMQQGHEAQLLPASQVRAFVQRNKDDAADARAIWLAAQHRDIRRVAIKTVQQQVDLAAHRMRSHWMTVRTATLNMVRGLLYELGVVMPKGPVAALRWMAEHRAQLEDQIPSSMMRMIDDQMKMVREIEQQVDALEAELKQAQSASQNAQRLREIPGIGLLGATALAATLGDGSAWRNAREFACCMGLVPRHTGTGGQVRMGGISKRGDTYVRTLLIHGARSLLRGRLMQPTTEQMLKRRHRNIVAVAVAHKLARTAWALVAHQRDYDPTWRSQPVIH